MRFLVSDPKRGLIALLSAFLCLLAVGCDDEPGAEPAPDAMSGVDGAPDPGPDAEADAGPTPDDPVAELMDAVDLTRYSADLEFVARGPRPSPDGENWQAAQDRCAEVFLEAGLEVVRQPLVDGGVNVIGVLPGTTRPDEQVLFGAHYDTEFACVGADDNATGVAAVLEAARVLGSRRFERTLIFACFDAEEAGLLGSADYAARARTRGDDLRAVLILEMIGYTDDTPGSQRVPAGLDFAFPDAFAEIEARESRGDFLLYIGDDTPEMVGALGAVGEGRGMPLIGLQLDGALRASPLTSSFRRSDHAPFWAEGYPGVMLTDTAEYRNPNYHCRLGEDDIGTVDLDFAVRATAVSIGALATVAVPAAGEPTVGRMVDADPVTDPAPLACDPIGQDCGMGQRCTLRVSDDITLGCVPSAAEPLPLDAECERGPDGGDACEDGLFCTLTGRPVGAPRRCRPLCRSPDDCPEAETCPSIGAPVSNCIDSCDPFADGCPEGTTCGATSDAHGIGYGFGCRLGGAAAEGEPCGGNDICGRGLMCISNLSIGGGFGCLVPCRPSAPDCAAGRICQPWRRLGIPDDFGFCLPEDAVRESSDR